MKLTIIPDDKFVAIDGIGRIVNFTIDPNIRAVQWNGDRGIVEQSSGGSRHIDDLSEFYDIIDAYNAPEPQPAPLTLSEEMARKLSQLSAFRYQKEVGGFQFYGQTIATDDRSKTLLIGARIEAAESLANSQNFSINWKTSAGFVVLDAATIIAISDAMRAFVQSCFDTEKIHSDVIMTLPTVEDIEAYDFTTQWPD